MWSTRPAAPPGRIVGLRALNNGIPLLGIGVRAPKAEQKENVYKLAVATAEKLGCPGVVKREDVVANTNYVGDGYGIPTHRSTPDSMPSRLVNLRMAA